MSPVTEISQERAKFLVEYMSPDILNFVSQRLASKGLKFPVEIDKLEGQYSAQMQKFYHKVFSGNASILPATDLIGLAFDELRQVDLKKSQMTDLVATVCFDKENNILVKYIVDQGESLESWAENNQVNPSNLKSMLDSYFLEFFNEKGYQILDGKLYQTKTGELITYDGFNHLLKDAKSLKDKLSLSGIAKEIGVGTENLDQSIENLVRNLNV